MNNPNWPPDANELLQRLERRSERERENDLRRVAELDARAMREGIANAGELMRAALDHVDALEDTGACRYRYVRN